MKTPLFEPKTVAISVVPHRAQRYDTVGDYVWNGSLGLIGITTSDMGDWRMNHCCNVHEYIESLLCINDGVREEDIAAFDMLYEELRHSMQENDGRVDRLRRQMMETYGCNCDITEDSEPGEDSHAPYHRQHMFADGIERLLARELGLNFNDYTKQVMSLDWWGDKQ